MVTSGIISQKKTFKIVSETRNWRLGPFSNFVVPCLLTTHFVHGFPT